MRRRQPAVDSLAGVGASLARGLAMALTLSAGCGDSGSTWEDGGTSDAVFERQTLGNDKPVAADADDATPTDGDSDASGDGPVSGALWAMALGDETNQAVTALARDGLGGVFVAGCFAGAVDLGGTLVFTSGADVDTFLARYDEAGKLVWSRVYGGAGTDCIEFLGADGAGNVVMSGTFASSIDLGGGALGSGGRHAVFLGSLGRDGTYRWGRPILREDDATGMPLAVAPGGDVYVVGGFATSIDLGGGALTTSGDLDVVLGKLSSGGVALWSKRYGGAGDDYATAAGVSSTGRLVAAGRYATGADFGTGVLPDAGEGGGLFTVRVDPNSTTLWAKRMGGAGVSPPAAACVDPDGGALVVGAFTGTASLGGIKVTAPGGSGASDGYAVHYTTAGSVSWVRRVGGPAADALHDAVALSDGFLLGGSFTPPLAADALSLPGPGPVDLFALLLSTDGAVVSGLRLTEGGTSADAVWGLAAGEGSTFYAGGVFAHALAGPPVLPAAGGQDGFVALIRL